MWRTFNRILLYTLIVCQMGCGCFCTGGRRHGAFPTVPFDINTRVPANWRGHIVAAEGTWTAASFGSFQFVNGPLTVNGGFNLDGENVIDFQFLPFPQVLAGTLVMDTVLFGCWIQEVDIVFNNNLPAVGIPGGVWDTSGVPQPNHFDVQTIALHELGHTLELLHVDCPSDSIMVPSYNQMSNNFTRIKRDLHGCDIAGMDIVYIAQWPFCLPLAGFCGFSLTSGGKGAQYAYVNEDYAKLADTYQDEVLEILKGDDQLMKDILTFAIDNQSKLNSWVSQEPNFSQQTLQAADVKKIDDLLKRLEASASPELSKEIENQREQLYSMQGSSLSEAFEKIFSVYTVQ